MDKYEYKIRAEEIRQLIAQKEYVEAVQIADTIDWRRVKSVMMLCTVSDLYKINRRFEESKELLLLAYDRHPGGRTIVYSLCELSIKMGDIVQAIEYYKEYVQLAPKDTGKYILQYKLYEAQEVSLEERIEVLEEFKKRDYREKWGYELAYLYHRVGLATKCVEECDELILWFGKGKYVIKAMELKMLHEPLTHEQEIKYRELKGGARPKQRPVQQELSEDELPIEIKEQDVSQAPTMEIPSKELDIQVKPMNVDQYATINLQKALAESMKEILGEEGDGDTIVYDPAAVREQMEAYPQEEYPSSDVPEEQPVEEILTEESLPEQNEVPNEEPSEPEEEEYVPGAYTQEIIAPLLQDTDELRPITPKMLEQVQTPEVSEEAPLPESGKEEELQQPEEESQKIEKAEEIFFEDETAEMPKLTVPKVEPSIPVVDLNPEIAKMLSQDYDGQISLVVPDQEQIEKQITGQLSIEDVLAEWERTKKENEQKRAEETKKRVLEHTGALFSEFDESTKNGILEQLQAAAGVLPEEKTEELPETAASEETDQTEEIADAEAEVEEPAEELFSEDEAGVEELEEIEEPEGESELLAQAMIGAEEAQENAEAAAQEEMAQLQEVLDAAAEEPEQSESEEVQDVVLGETAELPDHIESAMEAAMEAATESQESVEKEEPSEDTEADVPNGEDVREDKEEAVESEPSAGNRQLTEEEKDLYGSFIQTKREKSQIINAVDNMSLAPYTGNIIITGDAGVEKVELAKNLIKEMQMSDANFSGKVAKITGKALNKKDVEATFSRISNGALIIEEAGQLTPETLKAMNKALEKDKTGIMIIMEDTKKAMNNMLEGCNTILNNFTSRIDIEALNNDALVAYAKRYARELEYSIDEMGILALYTRIADMQTSEHVVTAAEVREMIDDAIYSANRKNLRHLMDIITGKRYDEEDMIILKEHDFML
ncbi:MAG: ATP-binding protein [Lachnospiraceae bacterium]|nr:ATP-binding protein [Lachnospiraceae bacterium]